MPEIPNQTSDHQNWHCERLPDDGPLDETDVSLRAHLARLTDSQIGRYSPVWSDDKVMEWDGNFRSDRMLMLVCCERDVDIVEYRQVLEKHIAYRKQHR